MNLIIIRKDGTTYDLKSLGIKTLDFVVSSPEYKTNYEEMDGSDGAVDLGTSIAPRTLTGKFFFSAVDLLDYPLLRNEVFKIFLSKESFYVIDEREKGKRWEVKCNSSFQPQQILRHGSFELGFICPRGFAESVGTTSDAFTFDSEVWQIEQGLTDENPQYTHNTTSFRIYNASDEIAINPRKMPLLITFKGASTNLEIKNVTTGDSWQYTGTTTASDIIKLDGIRCTKNGLTIFRNTNRKLLTIASGWNDFILTGVSGSVEITFDFRFYYL